MRWPILTSIIEHEDDLVTVRHRTRRIAEHVGFGVQDQTRIATAVSEIARNAFGYAGAGRVEYAIWDEDDVQSLVVRVSDKGPGIVDLPAVLEGRFRSSTGLGLGILGSRRLMDRFEVTSSREQGTVVTLEKRLPRGSALTGPKISSLSAAVAHADVLDAGTLVREHNRELLLSLAQLAEREEEARRLNTELAETNRGVVALHAELEAQAVQLREAGVTLESQVAARTAELAEANERLRTEAHERERIEHDLRQAQKMEAVGQLTGGIAHDFNNLLTGIVGSLDLMQARIAKGRTENLGRYIQAAMTSANRAAALTHRLLAFARRQPLDPRPTDANALIVEMTDLLRRTIRESIELEIETAPDLWPTLCDPHQLENAILNLAINARDAMPEGGRLTIETRNARRGETPDGALGARGDEYVCIGVRDTGAGMAPDVVARAFDPFFTTKPLGEGTGLGLSMVYGFARQSEGHARIDSRPGEGTTVTVYLPRHHGVADRAANAAEAAEMPRGNGETVLVVEDEPVVRDLIVEVLDELGYHAIQAADGPGGLRALRAPGRIDLLVTDVGLPGLNGRQLADLARETRPDLKVLFITGYAETATRATGFLDPGMAMITKPFPVETLVARIRGMIGERPA